MKPHAFVAMPFGVKTDSQGNEIDFNRVYVDTGNQGAATIQIKQQTAPTGKDWWEWACVSSHIYFKEDNHGIS